MPKVSVTAISIMLNVQTHVVFSIPKFQSATLLSMTVNIASEMHFNALRSHTTLLDCILYLMQYLYVPGNLPSSAN